MTPRERMRAALSGGRPDRVPFFPCIFTDHACVALGHTFEEALVNPRLGVRWTVEAGYFYGCDAVRVRVMPERSWFEEKEVRLNEGKLAQVDRCTGRVDGYFDVQGGGQLSQPAAGAPGAGLCRGHGLHPRRRHGWAIRAWQRLRRASLHAHREHAGLGAGDDGISQALPVKPSCWPPPLFSGPMGATSG